MIKRARLALLVLVAAGCTSHFGVTHIPTAAPRSEVLELEQEAGTHHLSNIVRLVGGDEAATWAFGKSRVLDRGKSYQHRETKYGHIYFWRNDPGHAWVKIGSSTYPAFASSPYPCRPTIRGAQIAGGDHDAVFIVHACLTGDGVLNAVAFANGPKGWGLVQTLRSGDLASLGHRTVNTERFMRPSSAARYDLGFKQNEFVTIDRTGYFADAGDGLYPRTTDWRWRGSRLTAVSSDPFAATAVAAPDFTARTLPRAGCPATGTFAVAFAPMFRFGARHGSDDPVRLVVAPLRRGHSGTCPASVAADTPMVVQVGRAAHPLRLHPEQVKNRQWVSAPVWMILIHSLGFHLGDRIPLNVGRNATATSPYVVPARLHANVMLIHGGAVVRHAYPLRVDRMARGLVTYLRGKVVGLAVRP